MSPRMHASIMFLVAVGLGGDQCAGENLQCPAQNLEFALFQDRLLAGPSMRAHMEFLVTVGFAVDRNMCERFKCHT